MGLFHQKLREIVNRIEHAKIQEAYQILEDHINAEHTAEGDLAGLAVAIRSYQQKLLDLKEKLGKIRVGTKLTKFPEGVKQDIAAAQAELQKAVWLIYKLRREAKIKLE